MENFVRNVVQDEILELNIGLTTEKEKRTYE